MPSVTSVRKLVLSKAFEKSYQKFTSKNQALKTSIEKDISNSEIENILLLDIGTHDDVY